MELTPDTRSEGMGPERADPLGSYCQKFLSLVAHCCCGQAQPPLVPEVHHHWVWLARGLLKDSGPFLAADGVDNGF